MDRNWVLICQMWWVKRNYNWRSTIILVNFFVLVPINLCLGGGDSLLFNVSYVHCIFLTYTPLHHLHGVVPIPELWCSLDILVYVGSGNNLNNSHYCSLMFT
jgi:hypothetical protein